MASMRDSVAVAKRHGVRSRKNFIGLLTGTTT
jgi:hypothetical protein